MTPLSILTIAAILVAIIFIVLFINDASVIKKCNNSLNEAKTHIETLNASLRNLQDNYNKENQRITRQFQKENITLLGALYDSKRRSKDKHHDNEVLASMHLAGTLTAENIYKKCQGWRINANKFTLPAIYDVNRLVSLPERAYIAGFKGSRLILGFNNYLGNYCSIFSEESLNDLLKSTHYNFDLSTRKYAQYIIVTELNKLDLY